MRLTQSSFDSVPTCCKHRSHFRGHSSTVCSSSPWMRHETVFAISLLLSSGSFACHVMKVALSPMKFWSGSSALLVVVRKVGPVSVLNAAKKRRSVRWSLRWRAECAKQWQHSLRNGVITIATMRKLVLQQQQPSYLSNYGRRQSQK